MGLGSAYVADLARRCDKQAAISLEAAMKSLFLALPSLLLAACAAQVSHPTKSEPEMRADIKHCTDWANDKYWMDPIAALYNAYDCLEAKGYQRERKGLAPAVEKAMGESRPKPRTPPTPCKVPCRPGG